MGAPSRFFKGCPQGPPSVDSGLGTTPLDAASADNAFISKEDLEEFNETRAFLKEYLSARGGKLGR